MIVNLLLKEFNWIYNLVLGLHWKYAPFFATKITIVGQGALIRRIFVGGIIERFIAERERAKKSNLSPNHNHGGSHSHLPRAGFAKDNFNDRRFVADRWFAGLWKW